MVSGTDLGLVDQDVVVALEALALGLQNAVVRHLAVPDMTTTVLTLTITGIGADLRRGDKATALRRTRSAAAMLIGAILGAVLVLDHGLSAGLGAQLVVLSIALAATSASARNRQPWYATETEK